MNFTVGNVRITVSFLLAVGLCAGTLLPGHLLPLLWLAILLHECGHFIYIAAAGKKDRSDLYLTDRGTGKAGGRPYEPGAGAAVESQRAGGEPAFWRHNAYRKNNAVYASSSSTLGRGVCHIAAAGQ